MRTRVCVLAVLLACAAPRPQPPSGAVVLVVEGKVENAPFRFGRDDLGHLPRRGFAATAPIAAGARTRFEGIALAALLADRMEVKREADVAVVHGVGGVAAPVSLALVRQLRPVLADSVGGEDVARWRAGAAPLQLAWPNLEHPGLDTDPRVRWWWVGGVSRIVLEEWTSTYGRALRVPHGAGDAARLGAGVLATSCIGCHRVRGVGGTRGPPLTGGAIDARRVLALPRTHLRQVSGSAGAPDFTPDDAGQVAAFVSAVRVAGPDDDEFTPPPPPPAGDEAPPPRPPEIRP